MRVFAAGWLLATALAGCAVTPEVPVEAGRAVDARRLEAWSARGRLAVAIGHDGGSGSFEWNQRADLTRLRVQGPLGVGALDIETDGSGLTVADAAGQSVDADAARERLRARLGADLPLAQMRYWLLGLPAPGESATVDAPGGTLKALEQSGWTVKYDAMAVVDGWAVPRRLTAAREAARVRVVVDEWHLPPAGSTP